MPYKTSTRASALQKRVLRSSLLFSSRYAEHKEEHGAKQSRFHTTCSFASLYQILAAHNLLQTTADVENLEAFWSSQSWWNLVSGAHLFGVALEALLDFQGGVHFSQGIIVIRLILDFSFGLRSSLPFGLGFAVVHVKLGFLASRLIGSRSRLSLDTWKKEKTIKFWTWSRV